MRELQILKITEFIEYKRNLKECVDRMSSDMIPGKLIKFHSKGLGTSEMMQWFCFVISITGLNRPNTEKGDDDDD